MEWETDRIRNGAVERPEAGDYISLTQSEFCPRQITITRRMTITAGIVPYYLSEEGRAGGRVCRRCTAIARYQEQAQIADDVVFIPAAAVQRTMYQGSGTRMVVAAMQGSQMAYDGHCAPMLVPYSVVRGRERVPGQS